MIDNLTDAIKNLKEGVMNVEGNPKTNEILYSRWGKRYSKTIKDFYEDFIAPRTPDLEMLNKWNELLRWYIDQPNAIYFLRSGNTPGICRRGWMCVQESFSGNIIKYIYDDNDLASYIYKMALDGFCPSQQEFLSFMTEFKNIKDIKWINISSKSMSKIDETRRYLSFPGQFTQNESYEYEKNVMLLSGITPVCCIGQYNYKLSHIFDVNKSSCPYIIDGKKITSDEMKNKYFRIIAGDDKNYKFDPSINNYYYKRAKITDADFDLVKSFLIAHTMRFLNPYNHFLAPHEKCNKFTRCDGSFDLSVAEYDQLLDYIKFVRYNTYTNYPDFVNCINANCDKSDKSKDDVIDIVYHEKSLADTSVFSGYRCNDGYYNKHNRIRTKEKASGDVKKSKEENTTSTRKQKIEKIIDPSDIDSFINNLDKKHEITMEIYYLDGSHIIETWKANNITKDNLWSNINSRVGHRKDKDKIRKVVFRA